MYVGTLTADEATFAGAKPNSMNGSFYISNKYTNDKNVDTQILYSTMSSYRFTGFISQIFYLGVGGWFERSDVMGTIRYVRPAVILNNNVKITGLGTQDNPYEVN